MVARLEERPGHVGFHRLRLTLLLGPSGALGNSPDRGIGSGAYVMPPQQCSLCVLLWSKRERERECVCDALSTIFTCLEQCWFTT